MRKVWHLLTAAARWPQAARARWPGCDRGDSPVPSAIIIGGLALLAAALLAWGVSLATDWMSQAPGPGELPAAPGDGAG